MFVSGTSPEKSGESLKAEGQEGGCEGITLGVSRGTALPSSCKFTLRKKKKKRKKNKDESGGQGRQQIGGRQTSWNRGTQFNKSPALPKKPRNSKGNQEDGYPCRGQRKNTTVHRGR